MKTQNSEKTRKLVQLAILTAIMLLFAFTPIGYLKVGVIEITFMIIPVAIGAMLLGPIGGAILGGVFGVTSFIQCFGMSVFGTFLMGLNPIFTFITCIVPRVLCGLLTGYIFKALHKIDKTKIVSFFVAGLSTALLNTFGFIGSIILFFWKNETFLATMRDSGITTDSIWKFFIAFVGLNGLVEAIVSIIVGAAVAKVLEKLLNRG